MRGEARESANCLLGAKLSPRTTFTHRHTLRQNHTASLWDAYIVRPLPGTPCRAVMSRAFGTKSHYLRFTIAIPANTNKAPITNLGSNGSFSTSTPNVIPNIGVKKENTDKREAKYFRNNQNQ